MAADRIQKLYRGTDFEAHWAGVIGPWLLRVGQNAGGGGPLPVILCPSRSYQNFVKSRMAAENIQALGLRFWTPVDVRRFLLTRFAGAPASAKRETLHLMLRVAAETVLRQGTVPAPLARSVLIDPDALLTTGDQLAAAGWTPRDILPAELTPLEDEFLSRMGQAGLSTVQKLDWWLLEKTRTSRGDFPLGAVLMCGFSGLHWPQWAILQACVRSAREVRLCLFDPRYEAEEPDQIWSGAWEEVMGEAEIVGEVENSRFQIQDSKTEVEDGSENPHPQISHFKFHQIHFEVGQDTRQEAQAIVLRVSRWLAEDRAGRIGVLFPNVCALAHEVSLLLDRLEIPYDDGVGHFAPGPFEDPPWQAWLALQERPTLHTFIRFLRVCPHRPEALDQVEEVRRHLESVQGRTLCTDLRLLSGLLMAGSQPGPRAMGVALGEWIFLPERATFSDHLERSREALRTAGLGDWIDGISLDIPVLVRGLRVEMSRGIFLRWLRDTASSIAKTRTATGNHPFARVHLVTYAHAEFQTWSHLIFTGQNDTTFPPQLQENGWLGEDQLLELNARIRTANRQAVITGPQGEGHETVRHDRGLCIALRHQHAFVERQMAHLLEGVTRAVCMTASLLSEAEPSRELKPGQFLTRLHLQVHGRAVDEKCFHQWARATGARLASAMEFRPALLEPLHNTPDPAQTLLAHNARRDPETAFGPYDFAFSTPPSRRAHLSVTQWERVLTQPALRWMDFYLGVRGPDSGDDPYRWNLTRGSWVHEWISRVHPAPGKGHFAERPAPDAMLQNYRAAAATTRNAVREQATRAGVNLPVWWDCLWRESVRTGEELVDALGRVDPAAWPHFAVEYRVPEPVRVTLPSGDALELFGRMDLLLAATSDLADRVWVVDFKTGGAKKLEAKKIRNGENIQLPLYALLLGSLGAGEVSLSLLSRGEPLEVQVDWTTELQEAALWRGLAAMQQSGVFGFRGEIFDEFAPIREMYPVATLEIDREISDQRWRRSHPFLNPGGGEDE
ncbi:MAG: PD-(D/E)XK nuclease family protein [Verrucomicrobiae bacterium]|nr:PD-(D/E)XK nuclease family protein [Verrucomicrobiae bacterium]